MDKNIFSNQKSEETTEVQNDKVWVSAETTVNLGNYENIKIMSGYSQTVLPDNNVHKIRKTMLKRVIKDVIQEAEKIKEKV